MNFLSHILRRRSDSCQDDPPSPRRTRHVKRAGFSRKRVNAFIKHFPNLTSTVISVYSPYSLHMCRLSKGRVTRVHPIDTDGFPRFLCRLILNRREQARTRYHTPGNPIGRLLICGIRVGIGGPEISGSSRCVLISTFMKRPVLSAGIVCRYRRRSGCGCLRLSAEVNLFRCNVSGEVR